MLCAKRRRWTQWHTVACAMFATALKFVSSLSLRLILFLVCIVHMLVPLVRARCLMHFIHRMCVCVCVCARARACVCVYTHRQAGRPKVQEGKRHAVGVVPPQPSIRLDIA